MSKMRRRSVLRAAALAGLASAMPRVFNRGLAQDATFAGPYWLFVYAQGGWDPRFLFDPTDNVEQNRLYAAPSQLGGIACAPYALDVEGLGWDPMAGIEAHVLTPEQFLMRHGSRVAVVNGIDTTTNSHDGGVRAMGSGMLTFGHPALPALIAGASAPSMPIAFWSGGGYDATMNVVPLTRVASADALSRVVRPNVMDPNNVDSETFHAPSTMSRILAAQAARTTALRDAQRLPTPRAAKQALLDARASTGVLERLALPDTLVDLIPGELGDLERFEQQGQMALAAFASGLTATASLALGGFDTHGNHDRDQVRQLVKLLGGVDYLIAEAERQGLTDRLRIVCVSDFARGPHYNSENENAGKDHWPITSMFALGPGIAGDRAVGATDGAQLGRKLDPTTLQPSDSGVKLGPHHVHRALRRLAGVEAHPLSMQFPLPGEDLALFG